MELDGKTCAVEQFSTNHTLLKTQLDPSVILDVFHQVLIERLGKAGLQLQEPHPLKGQAEFSLKGQFVRVDEGDRALRYFLTFLGGAATVEVEGQLYHGEFPVTPIHAKTEQIVGLSGGSGERLLETCAQVAACRVANQVVEALTER